MKLNQVKNLAKSALADSAEMPLLDIFGDQAINDKGEPISFVIYGQGTKEYELAVDEYLAGIIEPSVLVAGSSPPRYTLAEEDKIANQKNSARLAAALIKGFIGLDQMTKEEKQNFLALDDNIPVVDQITKFASQRRNFTKPVKNS